MPFSVTSLEKKVLGFIAALILLGMLGFLLL